MYQALDLLDQEAEEDEVFQEDTPSVRQPSSEANRDLVSKAQRYRTILDGAVQSDKTVRQKWNEWERFIVQLTWSNVCPLDHPRSLAADAPISPPGGARRGGALIDRLVSV